MADARPPEAGTLLIAVLLLLVLAFAGSWIVEYADPRNTAPWHLVRWFLGIAAVIVALALVLYPRRGSGSGAQ